VSVTLSASLVARLSALAAAAGQSLEAFLASLADKAAQETARPTQESLLPLWQRSVGERLAAWDRWCEGHGTIDHLVDDSRESIYGGRGD
jgi:hypothetical protein